MATLTYVYADSTAVLGPLATYAEPHTYDLCGEHAQRLTAPRGWQVVRLADRFEDLPEAPDDLLAVADAVREDNSAQDRLRRQDPSAGYPAKHRNDGATPAPPTEPQPLPGFAAAAGDRRGHLRVLRDVEARSADR